MGHPVVHFEITGTNGPALEKFYAELFGWHVQAMPEMKYGLVDTHHAGINGGIATAQDGAPTGVTFYVEGDDLQALLKKAESLGGKTLMGVTEIPNVVTIAMFADPAGNAIGLVKSDPSQQPEKNEGMPGVGWFEVLGPDAKALHTFYSELFGWHVTGGDNPMEYAEAHTHAETGIPGGIGKSQDGTPHTTVYAQVDDLDKYLERAESLGGKKVMGPMDVGDGTSIAAFADPQGNVFGLFRS